MLALIAAALLAQSPDEQGPEDAGMPEAITPDGGEVPTVSPKLTPKLAPIIAPEKTPDGGAPTLVEPTLSVYDVNLPREATITVGSLTVLVMIDVLIKPVLQGDLSCHQPVGNGRCNPAELSPIDRYAVGKMSKEWGAFGDIALLTSILTPVLYLGLESIALPTTDPWGDWGNDLLVIGESMALTGVMQVLLKFVIRRPRPVRYLPVDDPTVASFDQELSFPSGHTSMVSAATAALTTTVFLRHPKSNVRFLVLGAGVTLTALTGLSRVESGQHFPTDVFIGAIAGAFSGFLVPIVHSKRPKVVPTASFDPERGTSMFGLAGEF